MFRLRNVAGGRPPVTAMQRMLAVASTPAAMMLIAEVRGGCDHITQVVSARREVGLGEHQ